MAYLWASCALSVAVVCQMFMPLYIIVMPYLRHFGSFVPKNRNAINRSSPLGEIRRFENMESKMVYTTRGKCSVYYASRVSVFFLKKVCVCRRLCRRLSYQSNSIQEAKQPKRNFIT